MAKSEPKSGFDSLLKQARKDPEFFHNLIWDTENVLKDVDYLSNTEKARFLAIEPDDLVIGLATGGISDALDVLSNCGASCGVSCGISCGISCATSCATSSLITNPGDAVGNPVFYSVASNVESLSEDKLTSLVEDKLAKRKASPFSQFRR